MTAPFDEALVEAVGRVVREWGVDCSCSEVAKRDGRRSSWCLTHATADFATDVLAAVEAALPVEWGWESEGYGRRIGLHEAMARLDVQRFPDDRTLISRRVGPWRVVES